MNGKPNIVFVLVDQMRAHATGYAGDENVKTPYLDGLAAESLNFTNAVSNCPICTPYRAGLLTGQYPLTHGLFMNDLCLRDDGRSLAQVLTSHGYDTAHIGKWHLDGHGRSAYIPPERRQGFGYWKVLECTHDYNNSRYYDNDDPAPQLWDGYDAQAQTDDAITWLANRADNPKPFLLVLSLGPPHNPYETAPKEYSAMYQPAGLSLRPNVPAGLQDRARTDLCGYYAHITAIDDCVRRLDAQLTATGLAGDTIFIFTSDHGDSMQSNCQPEHPGVNKQRPHDESVMVPLLVRVPGMPARTEPTLIAGVDIMPTLLGLADAAIPATVEGIDYSGVIRGTARIDREAVLLAGYVPFADWRPERGGKSFRGIRTARHTFVRDHKGPWLLFDNIEDPYQMRNLVGLAAHADLQSRLDRLLQAELRERSDPFDDWPTLLTKWNYQVNDLNCIPYEN